MPVVETSSTGTRRYTPPVDRVLLEGPHSRLRELWLVLRTVRDFIRGFRGLHQLSKLFKPERRYSYFCCARHRQRGQCGCYAVFLRLDD